MIAEIDVHGHLTVYGENELESYALSKWIKDFGKASAEENRLLSVNVGRTHYKKDTNEK